ncbi:hypothetical protein N8867_03620 [Flavobacteriaceae bacterium]|nr:hypothetical protein [Flavobacteriaceae bacterium]
MTLLGNGVIQVFLIFRLNLLKDIDLEMIQMGTQIELKSQDFSRLRQHNLELVYTGKKVKISG